MVRRRVRCRLYAACNTRRVHCVAAGDDGVMAVHVDGGLRAVLSGAVQLTEQLTVFNYILSMRIDLQTQQHLNKAIHSKSVIAKCHKVLDMIIYTISS